MDIDCLGDICANSFRNFHTKGFDYLCVKRSAELTRKVYFFEGNLTHIMTEAEAFGYIGDPRFELIYYKETANAA